MPGTIIAGIAALAAAAISAGTSAAAEADEEKARKKARAERERRFKRVQAENERGVNLGAIQRQGLQRDIARTATGPAFSGEGQQPKTRGGDDIITKGLGLSSSSSVPVGDIVSGVGALAGAGIEAAGISQQEQAAAKEQKAIDAQSRREFEAEQGLVEREGRMEGLDFLAENRLKTRAATRRRQFNSGLLQAFATQGGGR